MTDKEMFEVIFRVKERAGSGCCCCVHIARNALDTCNWNEDMAVALLKEQKRLGDDFDLTRFRREYK